MPYSFARNLMNIAALSVLLAASPAMAATDDPATTAADDAAEQPETYKITAETENHTFKYSYPKTLAREPALSMYLSQKGQKDLAKFSANSNRDHSEAAANTENAFKLNPYDFQVEWSEEAEIPAYVSLSRLSYEYLGGAHGMSVTTSLLWDKAADKAVETMTLFSGAEPFDRALQKKFCAQLNVQRAEKRGHPIPANSEDSFEQCITPSEQTVILGSAQGDSFDTVSINVAPYGAGPYVEGEYQVDLPVTRAIISAVKPEYRSHFAVRR